MEIKECFGGDYKLESLDDSYRYGRIISIIIGKVNLFMDNVNIHHCLIHEDLEKGHFIVNDPISGYGGIIRSQGNSSGKLEMQNCKFLDNQYRDLNAHTPAEYWNNTYKVENQPLAGQGGAINWRSGASYKNQGNDAWLSPELIIRNCTFERNCAKQGGAIATCCKTTFVKNGTNNYTYISKNHAEYGGGLFFWSYNDGQKTYNGDGFDVTLGGEGFNGNNSAYVRVFDNFALYSGGGAYITIDPSDDVGFEPYPNDAKPKATAYNATFGTGCEIRNNRAPQGAGVTIIDNAAMRHRGYRSTTPNLANDAQETNPVKDKWSGILSRTITFDGAIVKDNYTSTQGTFPGSEAAGAGFYIVKQKSKDSNFANDFTTGTHYDTITTLPPGGLMTVNVMSGVIQNNHARQYKLTIGNLNQNDYSPFTDTEETTNPKPGKGGGFHIASLYDIDNFASELNVNIGQAGKTLEVFNNDAYTDGGGVYVLYDRTGNRVNQGEVTVSNGTIGKIDKTDPQNPVLCPNKALNGNGGGLCVLGGTVVVEGGKIDYNTAEYGLGGGVYVSVPNVNSETIIRGGAGINYNKATGGGGIYVDKGLLKVDGPAFPTGAYGQYEANNDNTRTRITNNMATAGNGGGIDAGNGTVYLTNTLIYYNKAQGSGDNKGRGGGIYLDGGTIEINTSKILYNTANTSGGGICVLSGAVNMKSGDVGNNNAQNNHGGGICVEDGNIVVSGGTVSNNEAKLKNGGGICVLGGTVLVEGGKILTNTAKELGGGVYVRVPLATTITTIRGGANISSNSAKGGGGIYVDKGILKLEGPAFASEAYGQTQAEADDTHTRITKNTASDGNGGGINAGNGEVDLTNTLIFNNTASGTGESKGRGGGVYLGDGTIVITDSKILCNTAQTNGGGVDNHNGDIDIFGGDISENTATTGNGGGIYTNLGDILVWPTAMKGDPDNVLFSQCEATKTTVLNNKAGGNGGGLNTHTGRFDVRFAQIKYNKAGYNYSGKGGGKGGGLFCEGPHTDPTGYTVRLIHSDLEENKAFGNVYEGEGITGRGGGVYLKYGSIFAEHCDIIKNEADINGGGLDNHEGELRVYGSFIDENEAKDGSGGGLYTHQGNIVIGPCDSYGYKDSKASRIIKNTAKTNGGGINNHHGDITIHGDRINENEAKNGDGGGVFIETGNIYMYGGQINENKADNGKGGGVYGGSGKFNIMERKANPIVEILEVEDIKATELKVHYHLVDRGWAPITVTGEGPNYTYSDPNNLTHGIAYSTKDPRTTPWTNASDSTVINYTSGTHRYVLSEGCVRVPSGRKLSAYTNYYVIAWAKYTISEGPNAGNYYDASPVVKITTIGSIAPVVATDRVSDISATSTTASATVSGELLYEGDGSGTVTKGIRYRTGENEWTSVPSNSTVDEFSVILTGLAPDTDYQAQAYATKGENTGYGEIITFRTIGSKAPQGPRSVYPAVEENPFFMELTPLQQAMLANTPEGDTTAAPASRAITDRDDPQAQPPVDIPEINENTAMFGGGICIDKKDAELIFAGSTKPDNDNTSNANKKKIIAQINYNYASGAGGGIYIGRESAENYAQMKMMGKCQVNYNHVPADKLGGGIYLDGRLYVGDKSTDNPVYNAVGNLNPVIHGLRVDRNFASSMSQEEWLRIPKDLDPDDPNYATLFPTSWDNSSFKPANSEFNNVFLTRYDYDYYVNINEGASGDNNVSVITLLSDISGTDANDNPYSHIGFSVLKGFCPVIATSDGFGNAYLSVESKDNDNVPPVFVENPYEKWLYELMVLAGGESGTAEKLTGAVFEDSESYVAVHTRHNMSPFLGKFIYLWGCWTHPVVMEDPEKRNPMNKRGYGVDFDGHYKIQNPEKYTTNGQGMATGTEALVWEIYSPEGLSWFTSYVNGLNVFDEKEGGKMINPNATANPDDNDDFIPDPNHYRWNINQNPKANAIIMNDLDMSAYLWVPIGSVKKFYNVSTTGGSLFEDSENVDEATQQPIPDYTHNAHYYQGTFDGQGHIIKGLQGLYLTGIRKFGLFGYLADDAVVKNTFVDEGLFVSDNEEVVYSAGGITGTMKLRPLGEGEQNGEVPVISNSEARMNFNSTYSESGTTVGGLVGNMKNGHIHSCMAMPSFTTSTTTTGQYVGGLVGKMDAGTTLKNSFSNVEFLTSPEYNVGGIAGENNGLIENVYVRYRNDDQESSLTLPNNFYWFVGNNPNQTGGQNSINFCYAPDKQRDKDLAAPKPANNRRGYLPTNLVDNKYGFAHKDQQMVKKSHWNEETDVNDYADNANGAMVVDSLSGLLRTLNKWVKAANKTSTIYTPWTRTMASTINDDYPVLMFNDFNVVGTEDGIYMKYDDNVNDMWKKPNYESLAIADRTGKDFQGLTSYNNPKAAMYLYKTNGVTATNSTPIAINVSRNEAVRLYIHEDVGITQDANAELHARVGVTIKDANWHLFSSALRGAPVGLNYPAKGFPVNNGDDVYETDYRTRSYMDPESPTTWIASSSIYFPTNTPYGTWKNEPATTGYFDLYDYSESYYHWINYKRANDDHWHMDADILGYHQKFGNYDNDETMPFGKGYLMSLSDVSMMMADGVLNNSDQTLTLSKSDNGANFQTGPNAQPNNGYTAIWRGIHLLGNPYQSYLNFSSPSSSKADGGILPTYAILDESRPGKDHYIYYTKSQSRNVPLYAEGTIHPHQGFFVKAKDGGGSFAFTSTMRQSGMNTVPFRDQIDYPLVNLLCYDEDGERDHTTVEVNRPEFGGGEKMESLHKSKGMIYAQLEGESFQILFAPEGVTTVPVRFEAKEDGVFTLNWNTMHGDFSYLHLIDNIAGVDVDCLTTDEYKFEGKTSDYRSRFKLVFKCEGDEPEPEEPEDSDHFAFQFGDELVVNGEGTLQMFDISGRCMFTTQLAGVQSNVGLPKVAAGVYVLRLTNNKQMKIQKMVIK